MYSAARAMYSAARANGRAVCSSSSKTTETTGVRLLLESVFVRVPLGAAAGAA